MKRAHELWRGRLAGRPAGGTAPRAAVTLLELLIVVAMLAILAGVAIPSAQQGDVTALQSAAAVLAADLRLARTLAITHDTTWAISFDTSQHRYELTHTGDGSPPMPDDPNKPPHQQDGTYTVALQEVLGGLGSRVRIGGAALRTSGMEVTDVEFQPAGGTMPHRAEETVIWLTTGQASQPPMIRLVVHHVTGIVRVDPVQRLTDRSLLFAA